MSYVSFRTPDGKILTFPEVFAEQAKRMLENYWVPQYYQYVSEPYKWPVGMAKNHVARVN